jgi:Bacterial extracellular solute-binding protein
VLGVVLVAILLGGLACSDAHSKEQLSLADNGSDPDVITLLAPESADPWVHALTDAYSDDHPNISFAYETNVTARPVTNTAVVTAPVIPIQRIRTGATPDVWIDVLSNVAKYSGDPRAQGRAVGFAGDGLDLVVKAGNPDQVAGLNVFGAGNYPPSGLCSVKVPCGLQAPAILRKAGVEPAPDLTTPDGPTLAQAVVGGKVAAGLILGTDGVAQGANLQILLVTRRLDYGVLGMMSDQAAAQFITWLTTSAEAGTILSNSGMLPSHRKS